MVGRGGKGTHMYIQTAPLHYVFVLQPDLLTLAKQSAENSNGNYMYNVECIWSEVWDCGSVMELGSVMVLFRWSGAL